MGAAESGAVVAALGQLQLSDEEIAILQGLLASLVQPGQCLRLIEEAAGKPPCPACGHANGLQRYRCVSCGRSFNALTGTPLARLRLREKWLPYLQCLLESLPVRAAAERVAVAKSTSFRWRHRFIAGVRREPRPQLCGIVERRRRSARLQASTAT